MRLKSFLQTIDQDRIMAAIQEAEARSRGEIRVHATNRAAEDVQAEAARMFEKLGMTATAERNGVLIYVAPRNRRLAIIGDAGIHERCGAGFWKEVAAAMEHDFREGRFSDGLVKGIARAGDSLAVHFPRTAAPDANELSNRVSED